MYYPRSIFLTVFIVGGCLSATASEIFQVSWDPLEHNPMARQHPEQRITHTARPSGVAVVDKTTKPPSPFDGQPALFVKSTEDEKFWFRLGFRAFEGTELSELSKGVVEFFLQPEQGTVTIKAGYHEDHWIPEEPHTYFVDSGLFNLSLSPGQEPGLAGHRLETDSIQFVEPSQSYRVTMKWDFEGSEPMMLVFLNGEPLRARGSPDPFNAAVLRSTEEEAINVFRITLGNSEHPLGSFFLGPMASADGGEDFDLESAEEPLAIP